MEPCYLLIFSHSLEQLIFVAVQGQTNQKYFLMAKMFSVAPLKDFTLHLNKLNLKTNNPVLAFSVKMDFLQIQ